MTAQDELTALRDVAKRLTVERDLLAERVRHLERQRDDLQARNTALVEENRMVKALLAEDARP